MVWWRGREQKVVMGWSWAVRDQAWFAQWLTRTLGNRRRPISVHILKVW